MNADPWAAIPALIIAIGKPAFVAASLIVFSISWVANARLCPEFNALLKAVLPDISSSFFWAASFAISLASAKDSARIKSLKALSLITFVDATFICAVACSAASFDAFSIRALRISFFSDNIFFAPSNTAKAFLYASSFNLDFISSNSFFACCNSLAALFATFSASFFSFSAFTTSLKLFLKVDLNSLT